MSRATAKSIFPLAALLPSSFSLLTTMPFPLSRTPNHEAEYRAKTHAAAAPYTLRMRKCSGPCNRTRSVGQFVGEDTMCLRCRRMEVH